MEAVAADFHGLLTTDILELAFATMDHEPEGVPTIGRHVPRKRMREMQGLIRTAQAYNKVQRRLASGKGMSNRSWLSAMPRKDSAEMCRPPASRLSPTESDCRHWWT